MAQFQPFDYGRAVQRGTQNALATLQTRGAANEMQRQQAIRGAFQGGASNEQAANALRKQGYGMAANELTRMSEERRSRRISSELEGMQFIAATAPMARDDRSWQAVKRKWENLGIADPGELPDQYDPQLVQALSGKARERLSASDLVEVVGPDGRVTYVPADEASGMQVPQEDKDFGGLKSSDTNAIHRQAASLYGGVYDPQTGEFRGLDAGSAKNALAISEQASRIYQEGRGRVSHSEAVSRAARQSGIDIGGAPTEAPPEQEAPERAQDVGGIEEAAMEGTGPWAAARQGWNRIIGPFKDGQPFPETEDARQSLRIFNQQIKQSLTANPKNPVAELNTIQGFLPNPDLVFTDPDGERAKIKKLRDFLKQRRELNQNQIKTAPIPTTVKDKFAEQNAQIDQALTLMDEFGGSESGEETREYTMSNPASPQTQKEYDDLPSGAFFTDDEGLKRKP